MRAIASSCSFFLGAIGRPLLITLAIRLLQTSSPLLLHEHDAIRTALPLLHWRWPVFPTNQSGSYSTAASNGSMQALAYKAQIRSMLERL
ncbi:hypothetical protein BOTBODRAFT_33654 [Botryobasidium botryosum FD-172 SS1]|uniref:Uncharacterized protein n=1 Tax=Botryobasidium botryosum (strain FD-172 SS1) TaxID=930990 RepID=A0A067MFA2_BOTB1|nr:hypothetical protein BOTBODRAFT_33654 [Botryobasidium botryosum FD-172 SS1]